MWSYTTGSELTLIPGPVGLTRIYGSVWSGIRVKMTQKMTTFTQYPSKPFLLNQNPDELTKDMNQTPWDEDSGSILIQGVFE